MNKPIPIAIIYMVPSEKGGVDVASQLTPQAHDNTYNTLFVSCACVSLYECFLAHVKESEQIEFEELFKATFDKVFEIKENYTDIVQLEDNDGE